MFIAKDDFLIEGSNNYIELATIIRKAIPINNANQALEFCNALVKILDKIIEQSECDTRAALPEISIVVPVFNEDENIPELYSRITRALEPTNLPYEVIFVDDGSSDQTEEQIKKIAAADPRYSCIHLARNFGHQIALSAGLDHVCGKAAIIMDGDLQDPPEIIPQLIEEWRKGYEVVYVIRAARKENITLRIGYALFYRLLKFVANIQIPLDAGDCCIMDRKVVNLINSFPERKRFLRGLRSWVGFRQKGLIVERHERCRGRSKYSIKKLLGLAIDGLTSFSLGPLRVISLVGILVSVVSVLLAAFYVIKRLAVGLNPPGFATIVVLVSFLAGIQLITLGVIGEYLGRTFEEVKRRPLYVVRSLIKGKFRG